MYFVRNEEIIKLLLLLLKFKQNRKISQRPNVFSKNGVELWLPILYSSRSMGCDFIYTRLTDWDKSNMASLFADILKYVFLKDRSILVQAMTRRFHTRSHFCNKQSNPNGGLIFCFIHIYVVYVCYPIWIEPLCCSRPIPIRQNNTFKQFLNILLNVFLSLE